MTLIFSPIEVLWPAYPKQSVFRAEWLNDIVYFLSTHLPIQVTSLLILLPATQLSSRLNLSFIPDTVGKLPWLVQFLLAILVADLAQYWIHRGFHKISFMWRFTRSTIPPRRSTGLPARAPHLVEDVVVRGGILIPMMSGVPAEHQRGLPAVREFPCHLGSLQFRADRSSGWSPT
jgi:lathosterol oxidase